MSSDNAANMLGIGGINEHHMWSSRCMSHIGNLLSGDIIKANLVIKEQVDICSNNNIHFVNDLLQVENVQTFFRNFRMVKLVEDAGGKRPTLFSNTRWCYHRYLHFLKD